MTYLIKILSRIFYFVEVTSFNIFWLLKVDNTMWSQLFPFTTELPHTVFTCVFDWTRANTTVDTEELACGVS